MLQNAGNRFLEAQFSNFSRSLHLQCSQIASLLHVISFSTYSKAFATYLILLKTLYRPPRTAILKLKIYWLLHVIERNWKLISVMYVPQITLCLKCFYNKGWRMIFIKRIYTPEESFPSRLFSYFTCIYLDKDKKFQMLVMTLRLLHNL